MKRTIVALLLFCMSAMAQTKNEGLSITDWKQIEGSTPAMAAYFAPKSIKRDGDLIKLWMRFEFNEAEALKIGFPSDARTGIAYGILHCQQNRARGVISILINSAGRVMLVEDGDDQWADETPGRISYAIFEYFCERQREPDRAPPKLKSP